MRYLTYAQVLYSFLSFYYCSTSAEQTILQPKNQTSQSFYEGEKFNKIVQFKTLLKALAKTTTLQRTNVFAQLSDRLVDDAVFATRQNHFGLDTVDFNTNKIVYRFYYCSRTALKCAKECKISRMIETNNGEYWCYRTMQPSKRQKRSYEDMASVLIDESLNENFKFLDRSIHQDDCSRAGVQKLILGNFCIDIDECLLDSHICDRNATCENTFGSYRCKCRQGLVGDGHPGHCFDSAYCSGRFCKTNGKCQIQASAGGYKCTCGLDCMNGGVCVSTATRFECKCGLDYTGRLCNQTVTSILNMKHFEHIDNRILLSQLLDTPEFHRKRRQEPVLSRH